MNYQADSVTFSGYTCFFHLKIDMYSPVTLYYLNQLGIKPWISKQNVLSSDNKTQSVSKATIKIIVLRQTKLNDKAEALFRKIIAYLNLADSDLLICDLESNILSLENQPPVAVLALGITSDKMPPELTYDCPILFSHSPEQLLEKPSDKRDIFNALNAIKTLISK